MKKKSKGKRIVRNIFLLLFILSSLGAVFYFGYYQFQLPIDEYAVIFTKISKWNNKVVKPGNFRFEWEGLIPFNLEMEYFEIKPIKKNLSVSGILPSASAYSEFLVKKPDFSYNLSFDINYILNPDSLPKLCETNYLRPNSYTMMIKDIENQMVAEAYKYLHDSIEIESKLEEANYDYHFLSKNLEEHLSKVFSDIIFIDFIPTDISFPDIGLYQLGKEQYLKMEKYLEEIQMSALKETETKMIKEQSNLDILKKYGEVFKEYPNLVQYFSLVKDGAQNILPKISLPGDQ